MQIQKLRHTPRRIPTVRLVKEIHDWTTENTDDHRMLSGALQAAVLRLLALSAGAKRILEIGMFTGYSALSVAVVLPDDGQLITLDIDEEWESIARSYFDRSEHGSKVIIMIGDALETIPALDDPFDMVYIDADKVNYPNYYDAAGFKRWLDCCRQCALERYCIESRE